MVTQITRGCGVKSDFYFKSRFVILSSSSTGSDDGVHTDFFASPPSDLTHFPRSGDVIHPQLLGIGSGYETRRRNQCPTLSHGAGERSVR